MPGAGENTFFGRAAALISGTHNVANLQKIMTRIGGTCLITIGVWCIIELAVQFGAYHHKCKLGAGAQPRLQHLPLSQRSVLPSTIWDVW